MTPREKADFLMQRGVCFTSGLVMNRPAAGPPMTLAGRLFQASVWREYAMVLSGAKLATRTGVDARWITEIGRTTLADAKRRARVNLYLARRAARSRA